MSKFHPLLSLFALCLFSAVYGDDSGIVSRTPPKEWMVFEKELVSYEDAKAFPEVRLPPDVDAPGVEVLVKEVLTRAKPGGGSLSVSHEISTLLKESAKEKFSTETFRYRPSTTRIHVAKACSILPDGSRIPVQNKAIFIEEVRSDSDILFDDSKQIRIVFPDTNPGVSIETVIVREYSPLFPEESSRSILWGDIHPVRRIRFVYDVPSSKDGEAVWDSKGVRAKRVVESIGKYGKRMVWEETGLDPIFFEPGMPSLYQRGPYLRASLNSGWEEFGKWFGSLIEPDESEEDSLRNMAAKWVGDAKDPREIANRLLDGVSTKIRYTGLEFGDGAYRPRAVTEVLETKYGDCKDKSNLLRRLLKTQGIESRIGLLNTMLPGEIPKKIGTPGLFDHAILAINFPGEDELAFCDPTFEGVPLGPMVPRDQGKDILLVDEEGEVEWAKTPVSEPGLERLEADLELDPSGRYFGFYTLKVSGSVGHYLAHLYSNFDRNERGKNAVQSFFRYINGVRVVDSEEVKKENSKFPFHYRFYVLQSASSVEGTQKVAKVPVHVSSSIVTRVGPENEIRRQPFLITPTKVESKVHFKLPDSWQVLDLPEAFEISDEKYDFSSVWKDTGDGLKLDIQMHRAGREFSAAEFREFSTQVRSFVQAFSNHALISKGKNSEEDWTADPSAFPKMPSADGYTALVNEYFPFDPRNAFAADHESREVAFRRMGTMYPDDEEAQFLSKHLSNASRVFYSDIEETREIVAEMKKVIEDYEGIVSAEKLAASEMVLAAGLSEIGDLENAREICERLFELDGIPEMYRQGAASLLGSILVIEDPSLAGPYLREALDSEFMSDYEWAELASSLVYSEGVAAPKAKRKKLIAETIDSLLSERPERKEVLADNFVLGPDVMIASGHQDAAVVYLEVLREKAVDLGYGDDAFAEIEVSLEMVKEVAPFTEKIAEYLNDNPWPKLKLVEDGDLIYGASDCVELYSTDSEVAIRYLLRGMSEFGPQPDLRSRISELCAEASNLFSDAEEKDAERKPEIPVELEPLLDFLLGIWKEAPLGEYDYLEEPYEYEIELVERREGEEAAEANAQAIYDTEEHPESIREMAAIYLIRKREGEGDIVRYLNAVARLEPFQEERIWRDRYVAKAAYASMAFGKYDEAFRLMELAKEDAENEAAGFPQGFLKRSNILLLDRKKSEKWWGKSEKWWPAWSSLAEMLDVEVTETALDLETPWEKPSGKRLKKITEMKPKKKRKRAFQKELPTVVSHLRFHEKGKGQLIAFLVSAKEIFPNHASAIAELITSIEE